MNHFVKCLWGTGKYLSGSKTLFFLMCMKFEWERKFIVKYYIIIDEYFHALPKYHCFPENYSIKNVDDIIIKKLSLFIFPL